MSSQQTQDRSARPLSKFGHYFVVIIYIAHINRWKKVFNLTILDNKVYKSTSCSRPFSFSSSYKVCLPLSKIYHYLYKQVFKQYTMSKVLVIFGATGQQGGSVAKYVLADPVLSKEFKVRAITRDTSKPDAKALAEKGAEVVQADVDDEASLKVALKDTHTVFSVTLSIYDDQQKSREFRQGKSIADTAVEAGAQYIIFSTLPNAGQVSKGQLQHMGHWDVKAEIEEYIRTLPIKSAFFAPGYFMQNFSSPVLCPKPIGDGKYALSNFVTPQTEIPLIETPADTGKWVGAMLSEPDKYAGKLVAAATRLYSYSEIAEIMTKVSGKTVTYKQIPLDTFKAFMAPNRAPYHVEMYQLIQDYGYFGPQTNQQVEWAANIARGKLTTLEEFLRENTFLLE